MFGRAAVFAAVTFGVVTAAAGGFGELFTGVATDPGTGPVLALIALAYWPYRTPQAVARTEASPASPASPAGPKPPAAPVSTSAPPVLIRHAARIAPALTPTVPIPPVPPGAQGTGIAPARPGPLSKETSPLPSADGEGAGPWG